MVTVLVSLVRVIICKHSVSSCFFFHEIICQYQAQEPSGKIAATAEQYIGVEK